MELINNILITERTNYLEFYEKYSKYFGVILRPHKTTFNISTNRYETILVSEVLNYGIFLKVTIISSYSYNIGVIDLKTLSDDAYKSDWSSIKFDLFEIEICNEYEIIDNGIVESNKMSGYMKNLYDEYEL